jgi:5-methylcytosine-specific restriction endonuclease McrA
MAHQTFFKHQMPSRIDERLARSKALLKQWRHVCALVDKRDGRTCRACGARTDPDAVGLLRGHRHHLVYRSAGGEDSTENLATLCPKCHSDEHHNRLRIEGRDANQGLSFWRIDADGRDYCSRRELAPGVAHRD